MIDEQDNPIETLGFWVDITERKRLEEQVSVAYDALKSTIDGVIITDLEGIIEYVNSSFSAMFGYGSQEEAMGMRAGELFPGEEVRRFADVQLIIDRVEGDTEEFKATRKDGNVFDVEVSTSMVTGHEGNNVGRMASFKDITERKRLEEELRSYSEDLEGLVEQRTGELLDAERMAAAGSVAAMVGHDLRGPLQTIKNAAYLLRKDPENFEEKLRIIDDSVDRAVKMIEGFREQTRETPLSVAEVDLGALLERAVKEASIPEDVNAVVMVGDGLGSVRVDALKIRRVMDNLVRNAVEAMPKGGELSVKAHLRDGGGSSWRSRIRVRVYRRRCWGVSSRRSVRRRRVV